MPRLRSNYSPERGCVSFVSHVVTYGERRTRRAREACFCPGCRRLRRRCERIRGVCVLCVHCGEYNVRSNLPPRLSRIVRRVNESQWTTSCMRRAPCPRTGNAEPAEPAKLVFLLGAGATSTV